MAKKITPLQNTNKVLAEYYKTTCMKLYTLVFVEAITIIILFIMLVLEGSSCGR